MFRRILITLAILPLSGCATSQITAAARPADIQTTPVQANQPLRELQEKLVGDWVLTGEIAGQPAVHDVQAAWTLQGNYVRLQEISREKSANGEPAYEATVYIGARKDHYVCIWLDITEVASGDVTCRAPQASNTMRFEFRDAQDALILTNTFTYRPADDSWSWRIENVSAGQTQLFGLVTLRRQ